MVYYTGLSDISSLIVRSAAITTDPLLQSIGYCDIEEDKMERVFELRSQFIHYLDYETFRFDYEKLREDVCKIASYVIDHSLGTSAILMDYEPEAHDVLRTMRVIKFLTNGLQYIHIVPDKPFVDYAYRDDCAKAVDAWDFINNDIEICRSAEFNHVVVMESVFDNKNGGLMIGRPADLANKWLSRRAL